MPAFFFNDTAPTEIYTLSLHDALPISRVEQGGEGGAEVQQGSRGPHRQSSGEQHRPGGGSSRQRRDRERDRDQGRVEHEPDGVEQERDRESTRLKSSHSQNSYAGFFF